MTINSTVNIQANAYLEAGFNPIPIKLDGSKAPAIATWAEFQDMRPTPSEMESFQFGRNGIAVLAGKASNDLEVIDIDNEHCYLPYLQALEAASSREFIQRLCIIKTPRPGYQIWYRCPDEVQKAQKLAMTKDDKKVLIETRGEGSYVIAPGSPPSVHTNNLPYEVISGNQLHPPEISPSERDVLINCARGFDQRVAEHTATKPTRSDSYDKKFSAVVEEFTESMTWKEILEPKGFILKKTSDGQEQYQKPESSNNGIHLSVNYKGNDLLRCFSTACPPFDAERNYSKLETYSLLNSNGNEQSAILELIEAGHGWQEEKPLMREIPSPEGFPVDALGPILGPAAQAMQRVIKAPLAINCQSVLAAATLAVQGHANVKIDGRSHPLSGFFLSIAPSGERKSAVDSVALSAHREHLDKLREQFREEETKYRNALELYENARKGILKNNSQEDSVKTKAALEALGEPPRKPLTPIMFVEEPTYEGLVKLLSECLPSVGVFSDEGGRFIGGHAMNKENLMKTVAGFNGMWDGYPISRSRSQDGNSVLHGRRVSMHLLMQPSVSQQLFSNNLVLDQGLLSRCLISWPEPTAGSRSYVESDLSQQAAINAYRQRLSKIFEKIPACAENDSQELKPRDISLTRQAKRLWIEFHDENESELALGKAFESIRGFANKAPEHAARLAGVMALFENIESYEITEHHMRSAICLVKYYRSEALRLFHSGTLNPDLVLAQKLLEWLVKKEKFEVTLTDIYTNGPSEVRQADTARRLMRILIEHGSAIEITGLAKKSLGKKEAFRIRRHKNS